MSIKDNEYNVEPEVQQDIDNFIQNRLSFQMTDSDRQLFRDKEIYLYLRSSSKIFKIIPDHILLDILLNIAFSLIKSQLAKNSTDVFFISEHNFFISKNKKKQLLNSILSIINQNSKLKTEFDNICKVNKEEMSALKNILENKISLQTGGSSTNVIIIVTLTLGTALLGYITNNMLNEVTMSSRLAGYYQGKEDYRKECNSIKNYKLKLRCLETKATEEATTEILKTIDSDASRDATYKAGWTGYFLGEDPTQHAMDAQNFIENFGDITSSDNKLPAPPQIVHIHHHSSDPESKSIPALPPGTKDGDVVSTGNKRTVNRFVKPVDPNDKGLVTTSKGLTSSSKGPTIEIQEYKNKYVIVNIDTGKQMYERTGGSFPSYEKALVFLYNKGYIADDSRPSEAPTKESTKSKGIFGFGYGGKKTRKRRRTLKKKRGKKKSMKK